VASSGSHGSGACISRTAITDLPGTCLNDCNHFIAKPGRAQAENPEKQGKTAGQIKYYAPSSGGYVRSPCVLKEVMVM